MEPDLQQTISLLAHTPTALNALLRDLPEVWTFRNEGEKTWSPFDVVGHLIHAERADWIPRVIMVLEFGETQAFAPFDREGHARELQGKSLAQLLDEFARVRSENLDKLRALKLRPDDLARRGRHPGTARRSGSAARREPPRHTAERLSGRRERSRVPSRG